MYTKLFPLPEKREAGERRISILPIPLYDYAYIGYTASDKAV